MPHRKRRALIPSWWLVGFGLLLAACQLPAGNPPAASSSPSPAADPAASPSPSGGSVQPVITF